MNRVVCKDAFELMEEIKPESIDLVLTDPPYESLMKWKGIGTTARMGLGKKGSKAEDPNKFFPTIPNSQLPRMLQLFYLLLKPNRHCYVMCDDDTLPHILNAVMNETQFSNWKILIWDKVNLGMGYHYRCQHEYIVMLDKGKNRRLNNLSVGDVLRFKPDSRTYPTQKPLALFKLLIAQSTQPKEIVLDPFVGSGTTAVAAQLLNRQFIVGDISQRAVNLTKQRLQDITLTLLEVT